MAVRKTDDDDHRDPDPKETEPEQLTPPELQIVPPNTTEDDTTRRNTGQEPPSRSHSLNQGVPDRPILELPPKRKRPAKSAESGAAAKTEDSGKDHDEDDITKAQRVAQGLISALEHDGDAFLLASGEPWINLPLTPSIAMGDEPDPRREATKLDSQFVRDWLYDVHYELFGEVLTAQTADGVINTYRAHTTRKGRVDKVYMRMAPVRVDGPNLQELLIDIGDRIHAVHIQPGSWEVVELADWPDIAFQRPVGYEILTLPEAGKGDLDVIRPFVNTCGPEGERNLQKVKIFLVSCYDPLADQLSAQIRGPHGSGKTFLSWMMHRLVHRKTTEKGGSKAPTDHNSVLLEAAASLLVAYDNIRSIPGWLSDDLCRLAQGIAATLRKYYTNMEPLVYNLRRASIMTSLHEIKLEADLAERSLIIKVPLLEVPEGQRRKSNTEYEYGFQQVEAVALAGLFDVVAAALERLPEVRKTAAWVHRMGEPHLFALAAEEALGFTPGTVDAIFRDQADEVRLAEVQGSPVLRMLVKLLQAAHEGDHHVTGDYYAGPVKPITKADGTVTIYGKAGDVLFLLRHFAEHHERLDLRTTYLPTGAKGLTAKMAAEVEALTKAGVAFTAEDVRHNTVLTITYDPHQDESEGL